MFIEFPLIGDYVVAVNQDNVTHVKQSHYAPFDKAIICFDEKSIEVNMSFEEVVKRLNHKPGIINIDEVL